MEEEKFYSLFLLEGKNLKGRTWEKDDQAKEKTQMRQGAGQEHFGWATNISAAFVSGDLDMRPRAASQSTC